jgi:hypothetical protein
MPSTSVLYSELYVGSIKMIDAVRFDNKEVLFVWNGTNMTSYVFSLNPILKINWLPDQKNFTMDLKAKNQNRSS